MTAWTIIGFMVWSFVIRLVFVDDGMLLKRFLGLTDNPNMYTFVRKFGTKSNTTRGTNQFPLFDRLHTLTTKKQSNQNNNNIENRQRVRHTPAPPTLFHNSNRDNTPHQRYTSQKLNFTLAEQLLITKQSKESKTETEGTAAGVVKT